MICQCIIYEHGYTDIEHAALFDNLRFLASPHVSYKTLTPIRPAKVPTRPQPAVCLAPDAAPELLAAPAPVWLADEVAAEAPEPLADDVAPANETVPEGLVVASTVQTRSLGTW